MADVPRNADPTGMTGARHPADPGAFVPGPMVHRAGAADGPLAGLTFASKELFDLAGLPTGAGTPDWARTHSAAEADAPVVRTLLAAGATLWGRTISDELALSIAGTNVHYGTPRNAAAPDRIPGGSSSGSASAVAHGLVDLAVGTDTGGSVRVPAACNGLYGIRPTHGQVSLEGAFALAPSLDTCGWFARDLPTLERVGEVLLGPEPPGAARRPALAQPTLIVATDLFAAADAEVVTALVVALDALRHHAEVTEVEVLGGEGLDQAAEAFRVLGGWELWEGHGRWLHEVGPDLGPGIRERVAALVDLTPEQEAAAWAARAEITDRLEALTLGGTAIVMPTMPTVAPLLTSSAADLATWRSRTMRFTTPASLAGLPQVTIPAARVASGESAGVPVGLSLVGGRGDDHHLIRLARLVTPG
jgi:amidase